MATYYRDAQGLMQLLRPMTQEELHRDWDRHRTGAGYPDGVLTMSLSLQPPADTR